MYPRLLARIVYQVGGLAARSVDGGDLNAEIVDDALSMRGDVLRFYRKITRWHS